MATRETITVNGNGAYQAGAIERPFRRFLRGQNTTNAQVKIRNSIDGGVTWQYEWTIEAGGDFGWHGQAAPQGRLEFNVANGQTFKAEHEYI